MRVRSTRRRSGGRHAAELMLSRRLKAVGRKLAVAAVARAAGGRARPPLAAADLAG